MTKTAIITGASSGIGACIADKLHTNGYKIIGLGRNFAEQHTNDINYQRYTVDFAGIDLLPDYFSDLAKSHPDVDTIICCAGYGQFGSLEEFSYSQLKQQIDVNFLSHAYLVRAFLPAMKQRKQGQVVFIGSEAALTGSRKGVMYCASKFALRGFAQALRDENSRSGISVSIINPGMTSTGFYNELNFTHGDTRDNYIEPIDIAEAVEYILTRPQGTVIDEINLSPMKKVILSKKEE